MRFSIRDRVKTSGRAFFTEDNLPMHLLAFHSLMRQRTKMSSVKSSSSGRGWVLQKILAKIDRRTSILEQNFNCITCERFSVVHVRDPSSDSPRISLLKVFSSDSILTFYLKHRCTPEFI
jgi:hypothetical protein